MSGVDPSRWHPLRVRAVVAETHDAKSIVFEVPATDAERFRYRPGQFLTLRLAIGGRHVPRCYSMSSTPGLDDGLRVTVKRVTGGRGSNWLCDRVVPGSTLEVLPPAGVFTPRSLDGRTVLLAGGSGITPVYSILRAVLAQGSGHVLLIYANRDERSVIFRQELNTLAASQPERLTVIHWLDSVQGVPAPGQLAELARSFRPEQGFICGPGPFMDAAASALGTIGLADARVHVERFVSLPDEEEAAAAAAAAAPAAVAQAEVEIAHQGQLHRITCGGQETILDAALRAGIELPHSCKAGLCASCMCQVTEGAVHLRINESLDQKDLSRGWTLACQAVPQSPVVRVRFAE